MTNSAPSDLVGDHVRQLRKKRGWSVEQLAHRCEQVGAPQLTVPSLYVIESGRREKETGRRRRMITVDELLALGLALNVSPLALLLPERLDAELELTPAVSESASGVFEWLIGRPDTNLSGGNPEDLDLQKMTDFKTAFWPWMSVIVKAQAAAEAVDSGQADADLRDYLAQMFQEEKTKQDNEFIEKTREIARAIAYEFLKQQGKGEEGGEDQEDHA